MRINIFHKPSLLAVIRRYNIRLSKQRGQTILLDRNILSRIKDVIASYNYDVIIEIGSGLGHLTYYLLQIPADRYILFEIDRQIFSFLKELHFVKKNNVTILNEDFLKYDLNEFLSPSKRVAVVGNIPFSISSLIMDKLVEYGTRIAGIHLTTQQEVAWRITAEPGTKKYSSITVGINAFFTPKIEMVIPPAAFFPKPRVYSSLLTLLPKSQTPNIDPKLLSRILKAIFSRRRKTVINSLTKSELAKHISSDQFLTCLEQQEISPKLRPEQIPVHKMLKLVECISNYLCTTK